MAAPSASDLTAQLASLAATGGPLTLDPTVRYRLDVTRLPASVGGVQLAGHGAVVEVVDAPATPGTVTFHDCVFDGVTFTAPSITNPKVPFAGYANARNAFRNCTFRDYAPSLVYQHGRGLTFENNQVVATDQPPPVMYSNVFCPLGDLVFRGNVMNFPPGGPREKGATGILVGASGPPSAGQEFSNWRVSDNRFLDADRPGYTIDTILDLEAGRGVMHDIWFERNVCFNGKVDCNTGDNVWITENRWRITRNSVGPQQSQSSLLYIIATGATEVGSVHVERNVYVQEPTAPAAVKAQAVFVTPQVRVRELVVKGNTFVVNGAGTPPVPAGIIGVHLKPDSPPGVGVGRLEISENQFAFTTVPANPGPLIAVNHPSPSPGVTVGAIEIRGNRVVSGPLGEGVPPGASGRLLGPFVRFGFPGHSIAAESLVVRENTVPPGSFGGRWVATPPAGATVGTTDVQGNTPGGA